MYADLVTITAVVSWAYFWSEPVMTKRLMRIARRKIFGMGKKSVIKTALRTEVLPPLQNPESL